VSGVSRVRGNPLFSNVWMGRWVEGWRIRRLDVYF